MKQCCLLIAVLFVLNLNGISQTSFIDYQKKFPRMFNALKTKEDTLKKQFKEQNLQWPPKQLYLRSFKYDSELEVWVRNNNKEEYKLFKTFKVCALSGNLGS
jgi:murein L,D-transpeptidase YafK